MGDIRKRKRKMKGGVRGGDLNKRQWTPGNKLRVLEGKGVGGWVSPMMGIKGGHVLHRTLGVIHKQ